MNALTIETIQEIGLGHAQALNDPEVRGVVITGAGEKAFVAGADIKEFSDFSVEEAADMSAAGHDVFNALANSGKPVVAAVNGFALGGGCELAMACTMRIASENARFGQPEVNLGLIPGYGGTQRLVQLVGLGRATELLLTGDMIDASEAYRIGLVNRVVKQEELMPACEKLLQKIGNKSPLTVASMVHLAKACWDKREDGFEMEIEAFANCFGTKDFKEGVDAFIQKRKPQFKGA